MIPALPKSPRRSVGRFNRTCILLAFAWCLVGCDAELEIANAAPRVTWVAVQPPIAGESMAEITVWVYDVEGDPVDLNVYVLRNGVEEPLVPESGSHGLVGLTTQAARFNDNGQPHLLVWNTEGLAGAQVQLRFEPNDRVGGVGKRVLTPPFDVEVGLREAVTVQVDGP